MSDFLLGYFTGIIVLLCIEVLIGMTVFTTWSFTQ